MKYQKEIQEIKEIDPQKLWEGRSDVRLRKLPNGLPWRARLWNRDHIVEMGVVNRQRAVRAALEDVDKAPPP